MRKIASVSAVRTRFTLPNEISELTGYEKNIFTSEL